MHVCFEEKLHRADEVLVVVPYVTFIGLIQSEMDVRSIPQAGHR